MNEMQITLDTADQYLCARIFGGLGNQMFQYAAAYAQAKRLKKKLLLHVVGSERQEHASFGLATFPLDAEIWDQSNLTPTLFDHLMMRAKSKRKHGYYWPGARFQHDGLTVNEALRSVPAGSYVAGYFQSEDYFDDQAQEIRDQFSLSQLDEKLDPQSCETVQQPGSVSVHIRRGDYLYDPKVLKIHGIMEDDYYEGARLLMQKLVPDAHFCIFSDDRDAADALTKNWPNKTLMPEADRFHDLSLMTKCSHHIIANSSFSWWGAWLNPFDAKMVIAPRRWYSREHMQTTYVDDICPKGWILI